MSLITLRVLDGADRGRVFSDLATPVTIGREEGNTIQLNDERISRFHLKIQEDHDKVVLTDLESTNGTRVNGEDIRVRILRYGDKLSLGRSVLLYGTREQIDERLSDLRNSRTEDSRTISADQLQGSRREHAADFDLNFSADIAGDATLPSTMPPEVPDRLSPAQAAQLSELIEFLHIRIRWLLESVQMSPDEERVTLSQLEWQNLLDLQAELARLLRAIGEPENDPG